MHDTRSLADIVTERAPDGALWERFHENTKLSRHEPEVDRAAVRAHSAMLAPALRYPGYPFVTLPDPEPPSADLLAVLTARQSATQLSPRPLAPATLAGLLHHAYGPLRKSLPERPAAGRAAPSAGGSYPLELFVHTARTPGVEGGLHHYDPLQRRLTLLRPGDHSPALAKLFVQPQLVLNASALIFVAAVFERSVFKYGDRGYRFVLLEAGHVAQTLALLAVAAELHTVQLSAYYDCELDAYLDLDGLAQSVIYVTALGGPAEAP